MWVGQTNLATFTYLSTFSSHLFNIYFQFFFIHKRNDNNYKKFTQQVFQIWGGWQKNMICWIPAQKETRGKKPTLVGYHIIYNSDCNKVKEMDGINSRSSISYYPLLKWKIYFYHKGKTSDKYILHKPHCVWLYVIKND